MTFNPWNKFNQQDPQSNNNNSNQVHDFVNNYRDFLPQKDKFFVVCIVLIVAITLWLLSGIGTVKPDEQAIVTRFGKYNRTIDSGLYYHLPFPIEDVSKESVTRIRTIKIGFYSDNNESENQRLGDSLMLTGDENIIDMQFEVQWKINDLKSYTFNLRNPIKTISDLSQSVIREIVAQTPLASILTKGRSAIENSARETLQNILNNYASGIEIVLVQMLKADPPSQVIAAFRDVQNARVDRESIINRAEAYRNSLLPKARGEAQKIIQEAEGYAVETAKKAQGQTNRFDLLYKQYKTAQHITKKRIYLETMEDIFKDMDKIIVDDSAAQKIIISGSSFEKPKIVVLDAENRSVNK